MFSLLGFSTTGLPNQIVRRARVRPAVDPDRSQFTVFKKRNRKPDEERNRYKSTQTQPDQFARTQNSPFDWRKNSNSNLRIIKAHASNRVVFNGYEFVWYRL